jgi:hypothetical protein
MTATDPIPDIQAAPDELVALARACRPAWDHDVLAGAILAAKSAGWTWDRTLAETVRLMRDPDGSPWDLKRAAADVFRHTVPPPGTSERNAAKARALLGYGHDQANGERQ